MRQEEGPRPHGASDGETANRGASSSETDFTPEGQQVSPDPVMVAGMVRPAVRKTTERKTLQHRPRNWNDTEVRGRGRLLPHLRCRIIL